MTDLTHLIIDSLSTYYFIEVTALILLPLGADTNALVYKVEASDQKSYFVKLKQEHFEEIGIAILELLQKEGVQQIIPPIKTKEGKLVQKVADSTLIVYPFIEGEDGFSFSLTDELWVVLGRALKHVHELNLPPSLKSRIRKEAFSSKWRDALRSFYSKIKTIHPVDKIAANLWKFLEENRSVIQQLVDRAEELSKNASSSPLKFVLCHSDIHGGNVLIDKTKALYIVDWDDPIMAPKERDLMFIGGGIGNVWHKRHEEEQFYQGYGKISIDWTLMAYYRYERIVEDLAVYIEELLIKPIQDNNRLKMYQEFMGMFEKGGVVEIALATGRL